MLLPCTLPCKKSVWKVLIQDMSLIASLLATSVAGAQPQTVMFLKNIPAIQKKLVCDHISLFNPS